MKTLTSVLFGAGVLAVAMIGATQPASARVGVYAGPYGFGVQPAKSSEPDQADSYPVHFGGPFPVGRLTFGG